MCRATFGWCSSPVAAQRRAILNGSSLFPNPKLKDMPEPGEGLEPLADARAGAAKSVEPIRTSARRAFNLFLRAADPPNRPAVQ